MYEQEADNLIALIKWDKAKFSIQSINKVSYNTSKTKVYWQVRINVRELSSEQAKLLSELTKHWFNIKPINKSSMEISFY